MVILTLSCKEKHPSAQNRFITNLGGYPPFTEMFFHGGIGYEFRNENPNAFT